ncbi:MAG: ACT domain-containing protein, partial [Melioribacteraceae bacterium]|nr:ACT domain-containing protein [Melioribacteraceae bacterium]
MALSEQEIRKITLQAIADLGEKATPDRVKEVVSKVVNSNALYSNTSTETKSEGKVILTSFGMNHPGIIAGVTQALSKANVDITDLSQKLMGEFYTMIIILDISSSPKDLTDLQNDLNQVAEELKI